MYAVVKTGGKQYKVEEGQVLRLEKISGSVGSSVKFDQILMVGDGADVQIGQPVLDGVSVEGHIVEQGKAKKIIVFKYKRRKRFRRKQGHRQEFTAVRIDSILSKTLTPKKAEPEKKDIKPEPEAVRAKEVEPKKTAAEKPEAKKAEAKEEKAKKAAPEKEDAKKAETAKTEPKKVEPQKAAAKKAELAKKETKKAAVKKGEAKKSEPKKTTAKKADTKKAAPKKAATKKTTAKKSEPQKAKTKKD